MKEVDAAVKLQRYIKIYIRLKAQKKEKKQKY